MAKVEQPLFGDSAVGKIGNIGTFRQGRHGPEFIKIAKGSGGNTETQQRQRACFAAAKAAHSQIVPTLIATEPRKIYRRFPDWPTFWAQWLAEHPECRA